MLYLTKLSSHYLSFKMFDIRVMIYLFELYILSSSLSFYNVVTSCPIICIPSEQKISKFHHSSRGTFTRVLLFKYISPNWFWLNIHHKSLYVISSPHFYNMCYSVVGVVSNLTCVLITCLMMSHKENQLCYVYNRYW